MMRNRSACPSDNGNGKHGLSIHLRIALFLMVINANGYDKGAISSAETTYLRNTFLQIRTLKRNDDSRFAPYVLQYQSDA
jgi:hypothetical protein